MGKVLPIGISASVQREPSPIPVQYDLFTGEAIPVPIVVDPTYEFEELWVDKDVTLVQSHDTSQLVVSGFGAFLSKKSERLVIRQGKKTVYEFPLFRIQEVVIASKGVSISSDLVLELCQRGIRLSFMASNGRPYAMLTSPLLGATVSTRRQQILAFDDERGAMFARWVVMGKLQNQERLLKYFGKYLKQIDPQRFERIQEIVTSLKALYKKAQSIHAQHVDEARPLLMGLEGTAGRLYWDGVKEILKERVAFMGRVHQGAEDRVNAMLNYGYGILYAVVWGAVVNAGLEPFAGFLHVDRPGKPSLVLDLVEEFRQPVVDRAVIASINRGEEIRMENGFLDSEARRLVGQRVVERLEASESVRGKRYRIRSIIQMQARSVAAFLRGEGTYKPFTFKW